MQSPVRMCTAGFGFQISNKNVSKQSVRYFVVWFDSHIAHYSFAALNNQGWTNKRLIISICTTCVCVFICVQQQQTPAALSFSTMLTIQLWMFFSAVFFSISFLLTTIKSIMGWIHQTLRRSSCTSGQSYEGCHNDQSGPFVNPGTLGNADEFSLLILNPYLWQQALTKTNFIVLFECFVFFNVDQKRKIKSSPCSLENSCVWSKVSLLFVRGNHLQCWRWSLSIFVNKWKNSQETDWRRWVCVAPLNI